MNATKEQKLKAVIHLVCGMVKDIKSNALDANIDGDIIDQLDEAIDLLTKAKDD